MLSPGQVMYMADAGLTPQTGIIDVAIHNNNRIETGDIAITGNGNVVLAWEDDGSGVSDFEAVWTLFDPNGNLLLTPTLMTNNFPTACATAGDQITDWTYRAYFRSDGSPTSAHMGYYAG